MILRITRTRGANKTETVTADDTSKTYCGTDPELTWTVTSGSELDSELLTGILHNRLGRVLTKCAGLKGSWTVGQLSVQQIKDVCSVVKNFELPLTEPMGMDSAQVTAGGILTDDFNPQTMESRLVPGLYAAGEVLDVDGDCGGYNLMFAFAGGLLAGRA